MFLSFLNPKSLMEEGGGAKALNETVSESGTPLVEGRLMAVDTEIGKSVRQLPPGARFRGEVRNVTGTHVTIQSGNETIPARFDSRIPISIGERLNFVIRENTEDKFVISPILDSSMTAEDQMLYKVLDRAGLAATDKNIDIVAALLKNQMPVSETVVKQLLSQSLKFPQAQIQDLVYLNKMKLPVTQESLGQLQLLREQAPVLKEGISAIARELPGAVLELVKNQKFPEARQLLISLFPDAGEEMEEMKGAGSEAIKPVLELEQNGNSNGVRMLFHALLQEDSLKVQDFLLEKADLLSRQFLREEGLAPEAFSRTGIQETVQKVSGQMFEILLLSEGNPEFSKLSESAVSVLSEAAFLSDVNGEGQEQRKQGTENAKKLIKLPLKMGDSLTQGDLYVYSRKKGGKGVFSGEELSLLLHLDMNALKNLNIMVKLKRKDLSVQIGTETEEIQDYLRKGLPELVEGLKKKGFFVNAMVAREAEDEKKVSAFLDEEEEKPRVKRYAFDMRV